MNAASKDRLGLLAARRCRASILIYVLWILVVISALAFQLASSSRVFSLNQSAMARQAKDQMQVESAIQFARFKIRSKQWENREYTLNLNNQKINVRIFNEAGYLSLYNLRSESLKKIFKTINIGSEAVEKLDNYLNDSGKTVKLNDYLELLPILEIDHATLVRLSSMVSILFDGEVNPFYSPIKVLMQLPHVDRFRVQQLAATQDPADKMRIRNELVEQLALSSGGLDGDLSVYYRVYISFAEKRFKAFLKYDRRKKQYLTVMMLDDEAEPA